MNKEDKINNYSISIKKKRKKLNDLEEQIKKLKNDIESDTKNIQNLCDHDWETVIMYGDPTSYECKKCGLWRRR